MTLQQLVNLSAATAALLIGGIAMSPAQTPAGPQSPFTLKQLAPGVYTAIDSGKAGSNAGFVIGEEGVLVIDSFYDPDAAKELLADIRKLTPLPIKYVVNTHYHIDHVHGNGVFKEAGATIIAQRNVRGWVHTENLKFYGPKITPEQKASVEAITAPELLVDEGISIYLGGRRVEVRYFPGHTGGDLVVGVPDARVQFCGDLLWRQISPNLIDGTLEKWIDTDEAFERAPQAASTTFVPGHGDVANVGDVADFVGYLKDLRGAVAAAMKSGAKDKALVQAATAKLSPHYRKWLRDEYAADTVGLMAAELEGKKPRPVPTPIPSVTQ